MFLYVSWTYQFIDISYKIMFTYLSQLLFNHLKKKKNQQMQDWGFQFVS